MQLEEVRKRVLALPDPIIITAHIKPDGDAFGAAYGLAKYLSIVENKIVRVDIEPCQFDELRPQGIQTQSESPVNPRSYIILDCQPDEDRIGFKISDKAEILVIDHHENQMEKTTLPNYYISNLPSACLTLIITGLWFPGSLPYYVLGSYTDTLSFRLRTMDVCGVLGVAAAAIPEGTFQSVEAEINRFMNFLRRPKGLDKLEWIISALEGAKTSSYMDSKGEQHNLLTVTCESENPEWPHYLIYFLQGYAETLVVINIEDMKGSIRTFRDIDLSGVSKIFGGGGHPQACGFDLRKAGKLAREFETELIRVLQVS